MRQPAGQGHGHTHACAISASARAPPDARELPQCSSKRLKAKEFAASKKHSHNRE